MIELRRICPEDQEAFLDILTDNTVNKTYMLPDFASRTDAIPLFQRLMALSKENCRFVRCISCDGLAVGFLNDVEIKDGRIEIGYVIDPRHHNKGYMTAALKLAIAQLLDMGYQEVICGAFEGNNASMRVMEKSGMRRIPYSDTLEYRGLTRKCIYYAIKKPRYPCLVLDHDDTVVQSEATVNYPCFCSYLEEYHPGITYTLEEYIADCSKMSFTEMCKIRFKMDDEELKREYAFWQAYAKEHIPDAFPGIKELLHRYRNAGGKICVVSMSSRDSILRDYRTHFDLEPDVLYSWELPADKRKPNPWSMQEIRREFGFAPEEMLVVDDMKFAVNMARSAGSPIAFAAWGRQRFPEVCKEMESLCDFAFCTVQEFEDFLFD